MPLPWKKPKSGRISRFVSDLQQSPKHGGSLVVETGFPTSLIDLFVKNRDRLKKSKKVQTLTAPDPYPPPRRFVSSTPPLPPPRGLLPLNLDPVSVTEESKIEERIVNRHDIEDNEGGETAGNHGGGGGGGCVLMVVVFKVFVVAVLALSTKKLAVGITLSAFTLLFLELAVARVFTLLNLCPNAQFRLDSLIGKLIGKRQEDEEAPSNHEIRKNRVSFEIIEESSIEENRVLESNCEDSSLRLEKAESITEEKEIQTIRDVLFKIEKSKSSKLKSKMKKIVPKKLRSYKKKKKMKMKEKEEDEEEEEETESVSEVSSLYSESEISERDDIGSNPPLLETCEEIVEEETEEVRSKGDLMKVMVLIMIALVGLLSGKVFAIVLTLSWCLILRVFCYKSQTNL